MINAIGRELPAAIEGYGRPRPFAGAWATPPSGKRRAPAVKAIRPGEDKLLGSLEEAFARVGVRDGMTLSFHHHLRNGDGVLCAVLDTAAALGLRDLRVAASSIFPVHAPLMGHIESGVVGGLDTSYLSGPVADAVSRGALRRPVTLRTHGGRARAIEAGELRIDVAWVAAPAADDYGNLNGVAGPSACGSLGYAFPDAEYADRVVAVTDNLVDYPLSPASISQQRVDHVVALPSIGDPAGIVSGTTRITSDPVRLAIAERAAQVIRAAGVIRDGFSYQTGAGGTALAVTRFVRSMMEDAGVVGSFALGGITAPLVEMFEHGLFRKLIDVQGFDPAAMRSLRDSRGHLEVGAGTYANPHNSGCAVNRLDCVVLGATEVDTDFNVNVVTGRHGRIMGGSGGHSDAAAGAGLAIVVAAPLRDGGSIVSERVITATTPGESIDVLVTHHGVAVNPLRGDLASRLGAAGIGSREVGELASAASVAGAGRGASGSRVVAVVEYRDGTVIDVVRQVEGGT